MIYLDNAATSWPKPECVYQAVDACLRSVMGSPGRGGHSGAQQAAQIAYDAREHLAALWQISDPTRLCFTQNATAAINQALFGVLKPGDKVVTTTMEHNAVTRPLAVLAERGVTVCYVPARENGELDLTAYQAALPGSRLVVMSHASNVTGRIQPVAQLAALAKQAGCLFLLDAAQSAGVEVIDVNWGIDLLAFTGHKGLLGPQGTGGLYVRNPDWLTPLYYGGTGSVSESQQQPSFLPDKLESGTLNTPGLAGLAAGVQFIRTLGVATIAAKERSLTEQLAAGLAALPEVTVYGPPPGVERTAVLSFTIQGLDSGECAHRLAAEYGILVRAGLQCAPQAHAAIGTLETGTVRCSPGWFNTPAEIEQVIQAIATMVK